MSDTATDPLARSSAATFDVLRYGARSDGTANDAAIPARGAATCDGTVAGSAPRRRRTGSARDPQEAVDTLTAAGFPVGAADTSIVRADGQHAEWF